MAIIDNFADRIKSIFQNIKSIDNSYEKYFIIGMPRAGKSVFFATMMHSFMTIQNNFSNIKISPMNNDSNSFISENINSYLSNNNQWIDKTDKGETYSFEIKRKNLGIFNHKYNVEYSDYPGEAFIKAFHPDPDPKYNHYEEQAVQLKKSIEISNGVFVIIDSIELYEGFNSEMSSIIFEVIKTISKKSRIAFVFTKKDAFISNKSFKPFDSLKKMNPGLIAKLEMNMKDKAKSFFISSVDTVIKNGKRVPPDNYIPAKHSKDLLDPIKWILNISKNDNEIIDNLLNNYEN